MLVEISGIDGSGKTTQIDRLRGALNAGGHCWAYARSFKDRQRRFLEQIALEAGRRRATEFFPLDCLDFASAIGLVDEALRTLYYLPPGSTQQVFVVDQYHSSFLAKAIASGSTIQPMLGQIYSRLPRPDVSILLDVSPEVALRRLQARPSRDQVLNADGPLSTLARLQNGFVAAARMLPYEQHVLDGTRSVDAVFEDIHRLVGALFGLS